MFDKLWHTVLMYCICIHRITMHLLCVQSVYVNRSSQYYATHPGQLLLFVEYILKYVNIYLHIYLFPFSFSGSFRRVSQSCFVTSTANWNPYLHLMCQQQLPCCSKRHHSSSFFVCYNVAMPVWTRWRCHEALCRSSSACSSLTCFLKEYICDFVFLMFLRKCSHCETDAWFSTISITAPNSTHMATF